jgi:hypothetical protein
MQVINLPEHGVKAVVLTSATDLSIMSLFTRLVEKHPVLCAKILAEWGAHGAQYLNAGTAFTKAKGLQSAMFAEEVGDFPWQDDPDWHNPLYLK